ncbi:MAG: NUDIX hydrolase [Prochloraceae cyanobacterium]|nr:NUDIX hydrolase [Prochloraceae cyanobacterium]
MPYKAGKIRLLALGLIKKDDRLFLSRGFDPIKDRTFYRAMGGGVDFGETSLDALKREFIEEINAEITNIKYLDCLENIFVFNGSPGHEIIQLYQCDFVDRKFYEIDTISFKEGKREKTALWVESDRFKSGELSLVPEQFVKYI